MKVPSVHPRTSYGELVDFTRRFFRPHLCPPRASYAQMVEVITQRAKQPGVVGDLARGLIFNSHKTYPQE